MPEDKKPALPFNLRLDGCHDKPRCALTLASQLGVEVHGHETRAMHLGKGGGRGERDTRAQEAAHGRVGGGWAVSRGVLYYCRASPLALTGRKASPEATFGWCLPGGLHRAQQPIVISWILYRSCWHTHGMGSALLGSGKTRHMGHITHVNRPRCSQLLEHPLCSLHGRLKRLKLRTLIPIVC